MRKTVPLDAEWLEMRLGAKGRTRADLARELNLDRSMVTRLVKGERKLKVRELSTVAQFLGQTEDAVRQWAEGRPSGGFGEVNQAKFVSPSAETSKPKSGTGDGKKPDHPLFGIWKGKVTLLPDYDYTQPADPDWGKIYED